MNFDKDEVALIMTGSVLYDDEVNHLTVRKEEWNLESKVYEVHLTCGVAKLSQSYAFHTNKSFFNSFFN